MIRSCEAHQHDLWSSSLSTEVLSTSTWEALFSSRRHASTCDGMSSSELEMICNIAGAEVKMAGSLFGWSVTLSSGKRRHLKFQAENEDEQMQWVGAVRRCSKPTSCESSNSPGLAKFLEINNYCADCNRGEVAWVSVNLCVTLCEDCALVHQQLGWCISKLQHISRDDFPDWMVTMRVGTKRGDKQRRIHPRCSFIFIPQGWYQQAPRPWQVRLRWQCRDALSARTGMPQSPRRPLSADEWARSPISSRRQQTLSSTSVADRPIGKQRLGWILLNCIVIRLSHYCSSCNLDGLKKQRHV